MALWRLTFIAVLVLSPLSAQQATPNTGGPRLHPWHNVFGNLYDSYAGWNSLWHLGAFSSTYVLAQSGADSATAKFFWKNPIGSDFGRGGLFLGWFWQITPAAVMYLWGLKASDNDLVGAGSATIQAIALTGFVTTVLKFVSGRQAPLKDGDLNAESSFRRTDSATDFRFFNSDWSRSEGRFFWPSGHTSSTITFVSALYAYYPDKHWIAYLGYPISLAMGISVLEHDAHWLSDVVAGALIGHIIGWTTGSNFRRDMGGATASDRAEGKSKEKIRYAQTTLTPRVGAAYLAAVFEF